MKDSKALSILFFIGLYVLSSNIVIYCAPVQTNLDQANLDHKVARGEASINKSVSTKEGNSYENAYNNIATPFQFHTDKLSEMKEILNISKDFFTSLVKASVDDATQPLFKIFPISDASKNKLKKDIKGLKDTIGPMIDAEYIGYRTIGSLRRFFTLYFISYHGIMPLTWELTFYQPISNAEWQLNFIRFNSDHMYEFLKYPMLRLNQIQKDIRRK